MKAAGEYHPLLWDQDGEPPAHYVAGHVSPAEFRAEVERWFAGSRRKPTIPEDAKIEHVYVRAIRGPNDDYGNRTVVWRHAQKGRGAFPMTYWELEPNLNSGG